MNSTAGEVLALLRDRGPMPRTGLARAIGISAAALTKITADLIASGQVSEQPGAARTQPGRPPVDIALNGDCNYLVGAHLGAGRVELVITDILLNATARHSFDFDSRATSADALVRSAGDEINRLIERSGVYRSRYRGIGVSVPGAVDRQHRLNVYSSFADWHEVPVADRLEDIVGLPAVVEHNATAIALSEARFGVGRSSDTILYVYMGSGIGAGLAHSVAVSRSPRHRGQVEIGHIVVEPAGAPCHCGGHGCLETVFSEGPILKALGRQSVPREGLIAAAMAETTVWEPIYETFVQALATTVTLLVPDLIVLGGHLGAAPPALFDTLRRDLPGRIMPQQRECLRIERTSLGADAGAKGAACVGLETFVYADYGRWS